MKRIILLILTFAALVCAAQTPETVLDRCVSSLKGRGTVSANYSISSTQGSGSGTIVMSGSKFRILSPALKCWYDGTTLWTYSSATGEVNITNPTSAELASVSPYATAQNYKATYNISKQSATGSTYVVKLVPKRRSQVTQVLLTANTSTNRISKVVINTKSNGTTTISISNYNNNATSTAATFKFDKSQVPAGTQVVDLR